MRNKFAGSAMLVCSALVMAAAPIASAEAKSRHRVQVCDSNVRHKSNNGTVIGAVGGGLLGNVIAGHGNKTEGTVLGAGVGAVAGHQIAKNKAKKNCRYEYRYY